MAEEVVSLLYIAPAIMGIVVSLVEIFFVMQDEGGMHPLTHALHAVPTCLIFVYISMNAIPIGSFLATNYGLTFFGSSTMSYFIIPIVIGLVATIKVKASAAIVGGHGSVGEKLPHALLVGALIAASPFIWPLIAGALPAFLNK